jgi:hypothetical protein
MDKRTEFFAALMTGQYDDILDALIFDIDYRKQQLAPGTSDFTVGDTIVLNDTANPQYLRGREAIIRKINRTKVVIDLVQPAQGPGGGFFHKNITAPPSMLSKQAS